MDDLASGRPHPRKSAGLALDRRTMFAGLMAASAGWSVSSGAMAAAPMRPFRETGQAIDLWPGTPPGASAQMPVEKIEDRSTIPGSPDRVIHGIARPRMVAFRPERPNGASVLVIPGGGYRWMTLDKGGYQIAQWLTEHGYTAFVLIYRLPGEGWANRADTPLADAQRAIRLIRARSAAWNLAPDRVATLGLSAGGHLCADLASRFTTAAYVPVDAADTLSARPWCAAPIYPVVSMDARIAHAGSREKLLGPDPSPRLEALHSVDRVVTANTPPHFLVHAEDDPTVPVENTLRLRAALKAAGVKVNTHLFDEGGHGFGIWNIAGKPVSAWPDLWLDWAGRVGLG
ncbi:alpha/beta hydrolase [Novosphingobium sp. BL-52-GroH]|uniref:alpha/beta hydrolase n=1 Tax=Novosphingobium sp. BL-52-GroH TaxID=3349877 RepID=UPI003851420F